MSDIPPVKPLDEQIFLQAMYKEQCDQARQHEALRQQSTAIVLTLAGVILSVISATAPKAVEGLCTAHVPWAFSIYALCGAFLMGLGSFGRKLSLKHYERNRYHEILARKYRQQMEKMSPHQEIGSELRQSAKSDHKAKWMSEFGDGDSKVIAFRLHMAWNTLHRFVLFIGFMVMIIAIGISVSTSLFPVCK